MAANSKNSPQSVSKSITGFFGPNRNGPTAPKKAATPAPPKKTAEEDKTREVKTEKAPSKQPGATRVATLPQPGTEGEGSASVEKIFHQKSSDTRGLKPSKVMALMRSIANIGIICPIAVDAKREILAGRHRHAASWILSEKKEKRPRIWSELFGELADEEITATLQEIPDSGWAHFNPKALPVRHYPFLAEDNPDLAREIQIAENEHRHSYTTKELRAIISNLLKAGYVYREGKGRLKKGEKSLVAEIDTMFGVSKRTVRRMVRQIMENDGIINKIAPPAPEPVLKTYRSMGRALRSPEFTEDKRLEPIRQKIELAMTELRELFPEIDNSAREASK